MSMDFMMDRCLQSIAHQSHSVDADWIVKYRTATPTGVYKFCSVLFLGFVVTQNLYHSYRSTDRHFKLSRLHNRLSANRFKFALLQLITLAYNCNRSVCPERNAKYCGLATISNPEHL